MVMPMIRNDFVNKLKEKTTLKEQECIIITDIIKSNKIIGRKNKEKIINDIIEKLSFDRSMANDIYNICMEIIVLKR